jgi:hypothetical protein
MTRKRVGLLVAGLSLAAIVGGAGFVLLTPPLKADIYSTCTFDDGLAVVEVTRTPGNRSVKTKDGEKMVTQTDGYRVMFAYPNTDYFVNLHADASVPGAFRADKETILEQMAHASQPPAVPVTHTTMQGFDVYRIDDTPGGVLGWYSLFDDRAGVTLTVYFLDQRLEHRKFQSVEEYHQLRDRFLEKYLSCVRANEAQR